MIAQHHPHRKTGVISGDMVGQAVTVILIIYKKSVTLPKGSSEAINRRRTYNTRIRRIKKTNNGLKNTKQKTEQQQCHNKQV